MPFSASVDSSLGELTPLPSRSVQRRSSENAARVARQAICSEMKEG